MVLMAGWSCYRGGRQPGFHCMLLVRTLRTNSDVRVTNAINRSINIQADENFRTKMSESKNVQNQTKTYKNAYWVQRPQGFCLSSQQPVRIFHQVSLVRANAPHAAGAKLIKPSAVKMAQILPDGNEAKRNDSVFFFDGIANNRIANKKRTTFWVSLLFKFEKVYVQ